jgi:hypothetical protein
MIILNKQNFTDEDKEKIEKACEEVEKIHETQKERGKEEKKSKLSLTDPEARWMKNKKGKKELSFNIQNTVDCERGLILKSTVIQDPTDHYQLPQQLKELENIYGDEIKESQVLADSIYNTAESIQFVHENNFNAFVPSRSQATKSKNKNLNKFAKANFTYDYEKDHYICPNNVILPYKKYL